MTRARGQLVRLERSLLWTYIGDTGMEVCGLWRWGLRGRPAGWALRGSAVFLSDGTPIEARYRVLVDEGWRTVAVHVGLVAGAEKRGVRLVVDDRGRWFEGEREVEAFQGCVDVDLNLGASTNTLPIRRFGLEVGDSAELMAAWVRFPDLALEAFPQRYTRLGPDRYRYESLDSDFTADLEVDDLGLVLRYPGWCEVVADPSGPGTG